MVKLIFTKSALRLIQSISCDVHVSVLSWKPQFMVDWRLLVKDRIANISISLPLSLNRPHLVVAMSVCLSVCPIARNRQLRKNNESFILLS